VRASTAFLARAGLVAVLAMAALGIAGRAYAAGESPTAFNLAQARDFGAAAGRVHLRADRGKRGRKIAFSAPPRVSPEGGQTDVIREAERWLGSGNFTGKPGAWCAWAVSAWLQATGHRPLASGMAGSALSYGPRLSAPRIGALAVLGTRRWASHVGLVRRVEGDSIELISGNWGHRVAIGVVPRRQISAFIGV
jgi:uncharacterized protein (TIGR02594 family)